MDWEDTPPWRPYAGITEEIVVTGTMTNIRYGAFFGFRFVEKVTLTDAIECIEDSAFYQCVALEEINIPASMKYIYNGAFSGCTSLKTITIPANVKEIDKNVFTYCSSLETVHFQGNLPTMGNNAFTTENLTIYYPSDNKTWSSSKIEKLKGTAVPSGTKFGAEGSGSASDNENGCGENLTWTYEDGTLTISGTGDMYEYNMQTPAP